jgi:acyl-CoA reductase-like NAD-dependent aldehyde dehydrogenase
MTIINHFISGAETAGSGTGTKPVYNPATGAVTAELRLANREDLDTTVAIAKEAAESWGDISLAKRTAVLFKFRELVASHVEELAQLITAEHGKVLNDAKGEIGRGLEVIEFACGIPQLLKGEHGRLQADAEGQPENGKQAQSRDCPGCAGKSCYYGAASVCVAHHNSNRQCDGSPNEYNSCGNCEVFE